MTQYDGPVFVQPGEPDVDAGAPPAPRVRPTFATAAAAIGALHVVLMILRTAGVPGVAVDWDPTRMTDAMEAWYQIISVGSTWTAPVAIGLGLIALRRREDGRARAGLAIGAAGLSLLSLGTVWLSWMVRT